MAYARDGAGGGRADYPNRLAALDWVFGRYQKIRFSFPRHIHLGPGGGAIRRAAFHLRNAGFFAHRASDCGSIEYRNGSLSDRARAPLDSATARVLNRNVGRDSECHPRTLGHFRDDSLAARFSGWTPFFSGPIYGPSMLAGGIIIAIMILPIVTSVSREILRSVPNLQREAAYALGATRWEATRIAVLSYAKK